MADVQPGATPTLRRALSFTDLLVYGLVFIVPIGPWSAFGFVFNASHGMVPLVYVLGLVAMAFTALSYMTMSAAFPVAGSVYAYAARGIAPAAGFLAGWALLLDYLLLPTLIYVACAVNIHAVIPQAPPQAVVVIFLAAVTLANLSGVEGAAQVSIALLGLQLVLLGIFFVLALLAVRHGVAGAHFTWAPLYAPHKVTAPLIFGALSLAVLSFLGFDGISTLAEEAKGGARAVGWATMAALALSAVLFIAQTYLASLFVLNRQAFSPGEEASTAFLQIANLVGGAPFRYAVSVLGVLLSGLAAALAAQAATARLLFGMARDGRLPRALAHVEPRFRTPDRAILFTAAVTLVLGVTLVNQLELLTSMVNFGALSGFLALHASVIIHFGVRGRSPRWFTHFIAPILGALIVGYVLLNAQANAKIVGVAWMGLGTAALLATRLRRPPAVD